LCLNRLSQKSGQLHYQYSPLTRHSASRTIRPTSPADHQKDGKTAVRRILGVLSLVKKYGGATVDDACAAALEIGVRTDYHFVRRYLERV